MDVGSINTCDRVTEITERARGAKQINFHLKEEEEKI